MNWETAKAEIKASVLYGLDILKRNADRDYSKEVIETYSDSSPKRVVDALIHDGFKSLLDGLPIWIVTEDSQEELMSNNEYFVMIDPVDGTSNYSRGIPFYTISVGLGRENKLTVSTLEDIEYSIVVNSNGDVYEGEKGIGATLNGEPIRVSNTNSFNRAVVRPSSQFRRDDPLLNFKAGGHIYLGSTSLELMFLACGIIDLYIETKLRKIADFAASYLIVKEAGGKFTDLHGNDIGHLHIKLDSKSHLIVASTVELHQFVLDVYEEFNQ